MRGSLNEIDLRTALQLIELGQRTGELYLETPTGQAWLVFFTAGKIAWAMNLRDVSDQRLQDCLAFFQLPAIAPESGLNHLSSHITNLTVPEYAVLCNLVQQQGVSPAQAQRILHHLVRETLFDLLNVTQAEWSFVTAPPLPPAFQTIRPTALLREVGAQLLKWQQLYPHVCNPDQVLVLLQPQHLQTQLPADLMAKLSAYQGKSLRRLGRLLGKEVLTMAKALLPYLQQGLIALQQPLAQRELSAAAPTGEKTGGGNILCVDDNLTVCQAVAGTLREQGYSVTISTDPLQALGLVFQLKPDLIFCDVIMPGLDGYQFCTMLRQTQHFRHTPMVMLTGKDAFIDRVLSRQAGATHYLSKPFHGSELLTLVKQLWVGDRFRPLTLGTSPLGLEPQNSEPQCSEEPSLLASSSR
jgi:twitching motility two-component system response regulator PilG